MIVLKFKSLGSIRGITLFPFILTVSPANKRHMNHERIHIRQQVEMLVIPFYLLCIFWHITRRDKNNPFEIEAFDNADNLDYLKSRKLYSWTKHI